MTITRHVEVHSASVQDRDGAAFVLDRITRRFPWGVSRSGTCQKLVSANSTDVIERTFAWACINREDAARARART